MSKDFLPRSAANMLSKVLCCKFHTGLIQIRKWLYKPGGQLVQRKLYGIGCLSPTTLEFADMMLAPRFLPPLTDIMRFAQHFMCLLRDHTGFVWFHMPPEDDPTALEGLIVRNWNSSWDIDGVRCIQFPPKLNISIVFIHYMQSCTVLGWKSSSLSLTLHM